MKRLFFLWLVGLLAWPLSALPTTLAVGPEGSTDFTSIGEALLAAGEKDTLLVAPGTYAETLQIKKNLTIRSASGESDVLLEGAGKYRLMTIENGVKVHLEGLVFTRSLNRNASALLIWDGAQVDITRCVFRECHNTQSNAVHVRHAQTRARFFLCRFLDNTADLHSAALSSSHGARLEVRDCVFRGNTSKGAAGAVNCTSGSAFFEGNLFVGNTGLLSGALAFEGETSGHVIGNTFHGNSAPGYAAVRLNDQVRFAGNIVSGSPQSFGIECPAATDRRRNILFDNEAGNILGSDFAPGEVVSDPLFCAPGQDDFTLCASSPALPANNGEGLIGAYGAGCEECAAHGSGPSHRGGLESRLR